MKSCIYPNLKDGYEAISQNDEVAILRGAIDPKAQVIISQEEDEYKLFLNTMSDMPSILKQKEYEIEHGILFCGRDLMAWMYDGEVWIRREGVTWCGKDVLSVNTYDAIKEILPH